MAKILDVRGDASEARAEIAKLLALSNSMPRGAKQISRFNLWNPHPNEYVYCWSNPDAQSIQSKKHNWGAVVVDVDWAKKWLMNTEGLGEYGPIVDADLDMGKNAVIRSTMVLMRYTKEGRERREGQSILDQYQTENNDIKAFMNDKSVEARDINDYKKGNRGAIVRRGARGATA